MNVTIINGTPGDGWDEFENHLDKAAGTLSADHRVDFFTLRDMNINYCRGCFSCWVKTPGLCVFRDDMDIILDKYVRSDFLIFAGPLKTGFLPALTKKAMDRIIPVALPYIRLFDGECHHPRRYENQPVLGLLLFDDSPGAEAVDIAFSTIDRLALNLHPERTFKFIVTAEKIEEVLIHEIGGNQRLSKG
ncbi:MAG: flavodoxin family protein [Clostridia bacterium]|nr:flavodoxin family protein [Clostridia bacterium]